MNKFKTLQDVPAKLKEALPVFSLDQFNLIAAGLGEGVGEMPQSYAALEAGEELWGVVYDFPRLVEAILFSDQTAAEKTAALEKLSAEFLARVKKPLAAVEADAKAETADTTETTAAESAGVPMVEVTLRESATGHALGILPDIVLAEGGSGSATGARPKPLTIQVELIQPGWGNPADNHYYPPETLRAFADRFVGAKMYESDHGKKDNRIWVSTVKAIRGFSPTGAPIAEVVVHSPDFAERARNLGDAELLHRLECSILAGGKARPGFQAGGRTGKRIEEIDKVHSVDWVTEAGAGGHATTLAESAAGATGAADPAPTPAPVVTAPVVTAPIVTPAPVAQAPAYLPATDVARVVDSARLPKPARARLAEARYASEAELEAAISREIAYLKEVTGSGQPFGLGQPEAPVAVDPTAVRVKVAESQNAVIDKYFGK